ncbi:hypothetical protein [Leclercia adecarboxylata]|uniref:hypothetical protein n=1 Tax=Leclercia adecarboxylata TaxID=83655 RepID=UPI0021F10C35|nr:hypothetical protein [Leclercia adecarboxylata]UYM56768.1 hypothetical protein N5937_05560 [Leclercia adecarboxylata]
MKGLIEYLKRFLTGSGTDTGTDTTKNTDSLSDVSWKHHIAYVFVFIVIYNFIIIPILALFGVVLPPVPLGEVWKLLGVIITGS